MAERYDPFKDETLGTPDEPPIVKRKRRSPVQIDWKGAARRLAEGETPHAVAVALGIDEDRVWRHLKNSLRFRFWLAQALERQRLLTALRLKAGGRTALLSRSLQSETLDAGMLRCLLDEEALDGSPEETTRGIEQLGETAQRPPNMAFRKRIAEERRHMDALVAESVALLRAREADMAASTSEAPRMPANTSEAQRMPANTGEAPRRPASASEAQRMPAMPNEPRRKAVMPPTGVTHPPARVDLEGPDLIRLREAGLIGPPLDRPDAGNTYRSSPSGLSRGPIPGIRVSADADGPPE